MKTFFFVREGKYFKTDFQKMKTFFSSTKKTRSKSLFTEHVFFRPRFTVYPADERKRSKRENSGCTSHSMFTNPWACYIPKMTFLEFPQKKPCIKTSKNHHFSAYLTRFLASEAKIEKNSSHLLKFRQFSGFSPNLKSFRYKL
jgi:hypothetical protein